MTYVETPNWPSYRMAERPSRPRSLRFCAETRIGGKLYIGFGRSRDRALIDLENEIEKYVPPNVEIVTRTHS